MKKRNTTFFVAAGVAGTALVLLTLLTIQLRSFRSVEENARSLHRTLDADNRFRILRNQLVDAETGQRGFLLTGVPAYLAPYDAAASKIPGEITALSRVVEGHPNQRARIARLDTLSRAKLAELALTIKLATEGRRDSALKIVRTNVGDSLMGEIRAVIRDGVRVEDSLRVKREVSLEDAFHHRDAVSGGMAILLALMLAALALGARRLQRYQDLVTFCAWSKAVNYQGEWLSFEEYLQRRFGLSATHGISPEALAAFEAERETTSKA